MCPELLISAPSPLTSNSTFVRKTRLRAAQGGIVPGTQSQYKCYYSRFVAWMLIDLGLKTDTKTYFELIGKGSTVTAAEIIAAGAIPLAGPVNFKRFIDEYYLAHGRVNGVGETSEHMIETMTRSVQNARVNEQYMKAALETAAAADKKHGRIPYWKDEVSKEYVEITPGLGVVS